MKNHELSLSRTRPRHWHSEQVFRPLISHLSSDPACPRAQCPFQLRWTRHVTPSSARHVWPIPQIEYNVTQSIFLGTDTYMYPKNHHHYDLAKIGSPFFYIGDSKL